ncbi:MAG: ABC transporter permease [Gemmatimonadaceae bacterium]|nr:ABC transporter permease [Gemmatimonadaceae bacterium]
MFLLSLALRSLRARIVITTLTTVSIALSVMLLVGMEQLRRGVRESFAGTIRGTDLIVGARGGNTQVLLSTVFGMAAPSGSVQWSTFERWSAHPAVAWTIPYALGDSHRGFRVIGTTAEFFARYRFRDRQVEFASGRAPVAPDEVAIGYEVATRLGYALDTAVVLAHGVAAVSFAEHEVHPFRVVGVIARTSTPIDRALYVTLDGLTAMHEDESERGGLAMGPPTDATEGPAPITAFLVGTKNRFETLRLQREMNEDRADPLTAVIPGVALGQLWETVGNAEAAMRLVALFTLLVGLMAMCIALYASLEGRRREMAILRAVGAGPRTIVALLVSESAVLSAAGAALGVVLVYGLIAVAAGPIEARYGLALTTRPLGQAEWIFLAAVVSAGALIGVIPAWKAYRSSLADGLSVKA